MPKNDKNTIPMEEISSSSPEYLAKKEPIMAYANGIYKNLGNVIKIISFIVSFLIVIIGFIAAFLLFAKTVFSVVLGFVAIVIFTFIAACVFFPLFGIGHILCQNDEILKKFNDK